MVKGALTNASTRAASSSLPEVATVGPPTVRFTTNQKTAAAQGCLLTVERAGEVAITRALMMMGSLVTALSPSSRERLRLVCLGRAGAQGR